jgi:hypothetical protein
MRLPLVRRANPWQVVLTQENGWMTRNGCVYIGPDTTSPGESIYVRVRIPGNRHSPAQWGSPRVIAPLMRDCGVGVPEQIYRALARIMHPRDTKELISV